MGRFSDIKRGGELNQKLTAYTAYLQNPPAPRLNSRGDRPPSSTVYVNPFGRDITVGNYAAVTASAPGFAKLGAIISAAGTGGEVLNTVAADKVVSIGRFRPARINLFENATKTKTTPNSRFTGKPYLKYAGEGFSCPFGRKAATDDIQDVFTAIKATLKARDGLQVNRVSLTVERFYE